MGPFGLVGLNKVLLLKLGNCTTTISDFLYLEKECL